MAIVDKVTLKLQLEGFAGIKGIDSDFKKFTSTLKLTKPQLDKFIRGITKVHGNTKLSKIAFEGQISALTKLRNNVGIGTVAYKRLGEEINKVKTKMDSLSGSANKQGGFLGKMQKRLGKGGTAALAGAAGRFLPASAQIGGIAGFADGGGVKGAIKGAGIGLAVDAVAGGISYGKEAAVYASEIEKLRIALKGVTKDQETFEKGLAVISETSKKLNVPIAASTRQFTTLSASVLGAGGTIEDAETVFTGVSNAIKATGGNAEDVQSAIRAMSQIFGKGKVTAEELQGRLGERLAGAVVKFAAANGSSLQKLQKDLRDGTVGLDQVITFAEKLNVDFADTAEKVANSSADAGQRLKVQMDDLKLAVGQAVLPIGAAFQKTFADIVSGITQNKGAMDAIILTIKAIGVSVFATFAAVKFLVRVFVDLAKILYHIANLEFGKAMKVAQEGLKDTRENLIDDAKSLADISGSDIFNLNQKPVELPATYKVMGVTYDAKTGAAITKPKGLATLTGDSDENEIAKISKGTKLLQQQERLLALKEIEDKFEQQILKRKQEAVIEAEKINQMKVGEGKDDDITAEQKAKALANNEELLQKDLAKIELAKAEAQSKKELANAKILLDLGEITEKEYENLEIKNQALAAFKALGGEGNEFGLTLDQIKEKLTGVKTETNTFAEGFKKVYEAATDLKTNISNLAVQGIDRLGDAFADFVVTGKASFKELAASILADLGRMIAKALFLKALVNFIPGLGGLLGLEKGGVVKKGKVIENATGNVFAKNKIVPYAKGGIVDKPTIFPMAKGMGLMGEAGAEGVLPLKRGKDGKLGVISQGGGVSNVTVNVDASGSSVEGDTNGAEQLGAAISQAIQAELLEQKRPGGLLYN